ncbi:peptide-methionine (S)-S-oxide reductase MsrA, partial [Bacillus sp. HC-Mk]
LNIPLSARACFDFSASPFCVSLWPQIDPTDDGGQFFDRGPSYRTAIFYHNETQKGLAEKSKQALAESGMFKDPIVTEIRPAAPFYEAEEYHQHFYKKNRVKNEIILWSLTAIVLLIVWYFYQK